MNVSEEVINILEKTGAVIRNSHFVGTSSRHMAVYVNKDYLLPHTAETFRVTQLFAEKHKDLDTFMLFYLNLSFISFARYGFHIAPVADMTMSAPASLYSKKSSAFITPPTT